MNDFTEQELMELQVELASIDEEFAELGELFDLEDVSGGASSDELSALDAELDGAGITDVVGAQSTDGLTMASIIEGDFTVQDIEAQGIIGRIKKRLGGFLKRKVAKLIRKIVRLVRKYSKLRHCVPKVTKAVMSFKRGKYVRALREAHSAYRCIRKHT